ncbi:MAG: hypothetical protein IRY85_18595 [Micromonosporaceae bacterium]|nr:hypothetical protein [Micromonosporaceae bacterium]
MENALRVHQTLPVPPGQAGSKPEGPTAADLARHETEGRAAIAETFGGDLVEREALALNSSLTMQRGGTVRVLAGGIDNLSLRSIEFDASGTNVVVAGTVETWSRVQVQRPDGAWVQAEPHNMLDFTMALTYERQHWVAVKFDWTFVPGTSP